VTSDSDDVTIQSGHTNRHDGMRCGYLGLQLTAVAPAMIGATWLFGGVAEDVVHGDAFILVDVGYRADRSHTWMTGASLFLPVTPANTSFPDRRPVKAESSSTRQSGIWWPSPSPFRSRLWHSATCQIRHRRSNKAAIHRKGEEAKAADLHHGADHFAVSTCWPRLPTAFHRRPIVLD
jgi:hypothetical protein